MGDKEFGVAISTEPTNGIEIKLQPSEVQIQVQCHIVHRKCHNGLFELRFMSSIIRHKPSHLQQR